MTQFIKTRAAVAYWYALWQQAFATPMPTPYQDKIPKAYSLAFWDTKVLAS